MNPKRIIGLLVCMLVLSSIPIAAGVQVEQPEEQPTDLIGMTWVRGWIFNPKTVLGMIHARAIRLHYFEITGMETDLGIVRVREVSFRDGVFLFGAAIAHAAVCYYQDVDGHVLALG